MKLKNKLAVVTGGTAGLEELLRPAVVQALCNPFLAA
jgi:hypothetical protein